MGNPAESPEPGVLCAVRRTIAFKRFRSALLSTFLPSPWQQAKRGGLLLLGNRYSCKDDSKPWLQISLFLREETEHTSKKKKKVCLGTREESGNCFCIRVFLPLFEPSLTPPLAAGSTCCFNIYLPSNKGSLWSQTQLFSECNRCIPGGRKTYVSTNGYKNQCLIPSFQTHAFWQFTTLTEHLYTKHHPACDAALSHSPVTTVFLSFYK